MTERIVNIIVMIALVIVIYFLLIATEGCIRELKKDFFSLKDIHRIEPEGLILERFKIDLCSVIVGILSILGTLWVGLTIMNNLTM